METIELGGRTGQEVYEELKHRLEGMGYLPDEYFLLDDVWEDGKVVPRDADLFCTTDYGASEGIYLDVRLMWYGAVSYTHLSFCASARPADSS